MMRSRGGRAALIAGLALAALPALAAAQQPTRRRQAPIVIKGQVPTPQIVTVRPREVPTYSRQVLVPRFYDHDFWPDIQTGYQMVPERQISGRAALDSLGAAGVPGVDSTGAATPPRTMTPPTAPQQRMAPGTAPSATPPAAADTARRTPGTPSAPPAR